MVGLKFGRLLVLSILKRRSNSKHIRYRCVCDCGTEVKVVGISLRAGNTTSCGCYQKETARVGNHRTHELSRLPEYRIWSAMKDRCYRKGSTHYEDYGGRGITVCERWRTSFLNFLKDMWWRPSSKHSIDRKDNDGNYEPRNCRWATKKQQNNNTRRNRLVIYDGRSMTLSNAARKLSKDSGLHFENARTELRRKGELYA